MVTKMRLSWLHRFHPLALRGLALVLVLANPATVIAADAAGEMLFVKGPVSAEREPPVSLAKGDTVFVADTIATGEAARAQILMLDGAKIAIRPNSRFRIEEFSYQAPGASAPVASTKKDRSISRLLKGGFRTITGAIGKQHEEDYQVRTPVGVLGIRGTDYTAVFCLGDCGWAPGVAAGVRIEDGLYLGVTAGIIFFRNETGEFELKAGQFAFVPLSDRKLRRLSVPPAVLLDESDLNRDAGGDPLSPPDKAGLGSGFDSTLGTRRVPDKDRQDNGSLTSTVPGADAPEQAIIGVDADGTPVDLTPGTRPPPGNRIIGFATSPLGLSGFSGVQDNSPGEYQLDAANNVTGFAGSIMARGVPEPAVFDIGTALQAETGFHAVTMLRWGRWSGGMASITLADGTDASQDLGAQSLHWISSPQSAPPLIPLSGSASYSLAGATAPTDNAGNVGVLGSATLFADFTNMLVTSTLTLNINLSAWVASGTGDIGTSAQSTLANHLFSGFYNVVPIDGVVGGNGNFSGFFSGPGPATADPMFPGGAGLTFFLQDPITGTQVSGAVALEGDGG